MTRVTGRQPAGPVQNALVASVLVDLDADGRFHDRIGQMTLAAYLEQRGDRDEDRIVIVDQFEECFTQTLKRGVRERSLQPAKEALSRAGGGLSYFLLYGEEYLAELEPYRDLIPGDFRAGCISPRLAYAAAQALMSPLKRHGVTIEDAAAALLLEDLSEQRVLDESGEKRVRGEYVEPVQLQVVASRLWEHNRASMSPIITESDVRALAGGKCSGRLGGRRGASGSPRDGHARERDSRLVLHRPHHPRANEVDRLPGRGRNGRDRERCAGRIGGAARLAERVPGRRGLVRVESRSVYRRHPCGQGVSGSRAWAGRRAQSPVGGARRRVGDWRTWEAGTFRGGGVGAVSKMADHSGSRRGGGQPDATGVCGGERRRQPPGGPRKTDPTGVARRACRDAHPCNGAAAHPPPDP